MDKVKKRLNKTTQLLSEKVSGTTGTELGDDIHELWRKTEIISNSVEKVVDRTKALLRPNPAERTKHFLEKSYHKARGEVVDKHKYAQPEFKLGEVLKKFGEDLDSSSPYESSSLAELSSSSYASSLIELGEALEQVAEAKDLLDVSVKHDFLGPLHEMQENEIKGIEQHKKKLEGRRLDYDYKEAKGEKFTAEELTEAEEKYSESKHSYYEGMMVFVIQNDVEHIKQLHVFAEAMRDYHKHSGAIMDVVTESLAKFMTEASDQSRQPTSTNNNNKPTNQQANQQSSHDVNNGGSIVEISEEESNSTPYANLSRGELPCCRALFSFDAASEEELSFNDGDTIELISQVDEHWLEGSCNGRHGYFPANYVEIMVPL